MLIHCYILLDFSVWTEIKNTSITFTKIMQTFVKIMQTFVKIMQTFVKIVQTFVKIMQTFVKIMQTFVKIVQTFVKIMQTFVKIMQTFVHTTINIFSKITVQSTEHNSFIHYQIYKTFRPSGLSLGC